MKIEIGPGDSPTAGFVGFDMNPLCADVVADAACLPLRSASVEEIVAFDVLEHLPWASTGAVLAEWYRVLVPGGRLTVRVPDAASEVHRWVAAGGDDMARLNWHLLGTPEVLWQGHKALFSAWSLDCALSAAGFVVSRLESDPHPNVTAYAHC